MWKVKLFNKLFGWEYIVFSCGNEQVVRRVITCPNGTKVVRYYGCFGILDEDAQRLHTGRHYIKLTN